jgi:hypothetical protein
LEVATMKINGKDWFGGEDHEVEAFARQIEAEAADDEYLVDALLSDGLDEDGRRRKAG